MKKFTIKSLALTLALTLLTTTAQTIPAEAKSKPKIVATGLSGNHICVTSYETAGREPVQLKVKNANGKKVTWKISFGAHRAKISKTGKLTCIKTGPIVVQAKIGKKTVSKHFRICEHNFGKKQLLWMYNPSIAPYCYDRDTCKYCGTEKPEWLRSRADEKQGVLNLINAITTPDMSDRDKVAAYAAWELCSMANPECIMGWDVEHNFLSATADKYIPDWSKITMDQSTWDLSSFDSHGQRIPFISNATEFLSTSYVQGYVPSQTCADVSQRAFLFFHLLGLKTVIDVDENYIHANCLVYVDGHWIDTSDIRFYSKKGESYYSFEPLEDSETLEGYASANETIRYARGEAEALYNIGEINDVYDYEEENENFPKGW